MSLTLGRFVEFPRAAPSGIPQTSLGYRGHLITNFPHIMVLLIITSSACPTPACIISQYYTVFHKVKISRVFNTV